MNAPSDTPPPLQAAGPALSPGRTLRRLFLTLFLRGRSSRGLRKESAPKSVGSKLALALVFYALFGVFALFFLQQPVFALSVYLHAMTLVFLGMFVAASAGEVLFNKDEADILMHRPVTPRALLWAKIGVLTEVSLWLAGAFNLAGFFVGIGGKDGGWLFPIAHAISTIMEALFCTGTVVLVYQLCLRWFGRERLDGLMTTAQVFVAVAAVVAGQVVPRLLIRISGTIKFNAGSWWIGLLPPAWFAGFDDAFAGRGIRSSWELAGFGLPMALNTASTSGQRLKLKNTSANAADLGAAGVTAGTGFDLAAGATGDVQLQPNDVLYAIRSAAADATLAILRS